METHNSMHMQQICTGGCLQSILLAQHFVKQLCCIPRVYIYSIRNCSAVQYSAVQYSACSAAYVGRVREEGRREEEGQVIIHFIISLS